MQQTENHLAELADLKQALLAFLGDADSELQLFGELFKQVSFTEVVDKLPEEQRKLLLEQQQDWLVNAISLLKSEREVVVNALEKIQLAKKVKASYHTVQKG